MASRPPRGTDGVSSLPADMPSTGATLTPREADRVQEVAARRLDKLSGACERVDLDPVPLRVGAGLEAEHALRRGDEIAASGPARVGDDRGPVVADQARQDTQKSLD